MELPWWGSSPVANSRAVTSTFRASKGAGRGNLCLRGAGLPRLAIDLGCPDFSSREVTCQLKSKKPVGTMI